MRKCNLVFLFQRRNELTSSASQYFFRTQNASSPWILSQTGNFLAKRIEYTRSLVQLASSRLCPLQQRCVSNFALHNRLPARAEYIPLPPRLSAESLQFSKKTSNTPKRQERARFWIWMLQLLRVLDSPTQARFLMAFFTNSSRLNDAQFSSSEFWSEGLKFW